MVAPAKQYLFTESTDLAGELRAAAGLGDLEVVA